MGSLNFGSTCCINYCKYESEIKNDTRTFNKFNFKIIKLQSVIRRYLVRSKVKLTSSIKQQNWNDKKIKANSETSIILKFISQQDYTNEKVYNIENKLGPFISTEKESLNKTFSNLKKHSVIFKDNSIFQGYFNNNWQKEGYGVLYLPDGSKYEGYFQKDKLCGKGRLLSVSGFYYEGNFGNSQANGFGKYVRNDGTVYVGYWKNDKQHGLGEEVFPDGSRYEGQFENGERHGKGLFIFQDNSKYEGDFSRNILQGYGTYTWNDGRQYKGTWMNNKMHGKGIFLWPDRKKYIGQYRNDKKHGYGIFFWPNGKVYQGHWNNGKQHGFGLFCFNSFCQLGDWEKGKKIRSIENSDKDYEEIMKLLMQKKSLLNLCDS